MNLSHLKVIYAVFSLLGIHLIEPFYARTIQQDATHTTLKAFYQGLHSNLINDKASIQFLSLDKPFFSGVSDNLFSAVKDSYGPTVVASVIEVAHEHETDVLMLVNHLLPELGKTLARQRRDYGLDEEAFPVEFRVEEQAMNIDDTPTNNMEMERLMGRTDYRLQKLQTLGAASRSIILQKTKALREASQDPGFRSFRLQAQKKRDKEVEWNAKVKEQFKSSAEKKQEAALGQERKRLLMLEDLKKSGGPFTNAEEVETFLKETDVSLKKEENEKRKKVRMKKEVQFARESSTTLPRVDPLFKIQVTGKNKKRRDKTAEEFGISLMCYLGKQADRTVMRYETFQTSLRELVTG